MFSPTVGKSEYLYPLLEMLYFYDFERAGTFGVLNGILCDTRTVLSKAHEIGNILGNQVAWDPQSY
jgi:hypothetical protein